MGRIKHSKQGEKTTYNVTNTQFQVKGNAPPNKGSNPRTVQAPIL